MWTRVCHIPHYMAKIAFLHFTRRPTTLDPSGSAFLMFLLLLVLLLPRVMLLLMHCASVGHSFIVCREFLRQTRRDFLRATKDLSALSRLLGQLRRLSRVSKRLPLIFLLACFQAYAMTICWINLLLPYSLTRHWIENYYYHYFLNFNDPSCH